MNSLTQNGRRFKHPPFYQNLLLVIILSLLFTAPLSYQHWIRVGESISQILRAIELSRGVQEGYLYPRWFGDLAGGFGYPYFVFYAPLIYYVSEFFHLVGFGIVTSMKFMIILGVILSGVGMFLLTRRLWGNFGALVSAIAYVYVPYRMVNLYVRGDFAEAFAMAILPFVLYFFYQWLTQKNQFNLLGSAISYALLILTHNCTALIFSGFLISFVAFISVQKKDWSCLGRGLLAFIWAYGLSAIFWLPALIEKEWVNIHLIYSDAALDFHNHFIEPFRLLSSKWRFDEMGGGRHLPIQIGVPHILLLIFSLGYIFNLDASKEKEIKHLSIFFLLLVTVAVFMTNASSTFLWENIPLMKYLQFPWRFMSVLSLFISILCGGLFAYFKKESMTVQQMLQTVLVIIIIISGIQYCRVPGYWVLNEKMLTPSYVRKDGGTLSSHNTDEMDKIIDYGEYLPKTVKKLPDKKNAGKVFKTKGAAEILDLKVQIQKYEFSVFAEENAEIVIGSFYYPSWKGLIDNKALSLFTDDEGLIHLKVPKGEHNIVVFFGDTIIRKLSKYISYFSLIMIFVILVLRWRKPFGLLQKIKS